MKKEYTIFFAIPFDALTRKIYSDICDKDLKEYFKSKGCSLITIIGNQKVGPSPEYSEIATFKAQNVDLHKQFFKDIAEADIVVADLTNNNHNVHLELGIALTLNKNILRVTGRSPSELGFDIRNLEVKSYSNRSELIEIIKQYIETFLKIKNLVFSPEYRNLYKMTQGPILLPGTKEELGKNSFWYTTNSFTQEVFRDGALNVEFKFLNNLNVDSWFGIYFRAAREFLWDSYLLYIRKNGSVELGLYPGPIIEAKKQLADSSVLNGDVELQIQFENNSLEVKIHNETFHFTNLRRQRLGNIFIATWESRAEFRDVESINRDAIELFKE